MPVSIPFLYDQSPKDEIGSMLMIYLDIPLVTVKCNPEYAIDLASGILPADKFILSLNDL